MKLRHCRHLFFAGVLLLLDLVGIRVLSKVFFLGCFASSWFFLVLVFCLMDLFKCVVSAENIPWNCTLSNPLESCSKESFYLFYLPCQLISCSEWSCLVVLLFLFIVFSTFFRNFISKFAASWISLKNLYTFCSSWSIALKGTPRLMSFSNRRLLDSQSIRLFTKAGFWSELI